MRHAGIVLAAAVLLAAYGAQAQETSDARAWRSTASVGVNRTPNYQSRIESLEEALSEAPTAEHAADTLYHLSKVYEQVPDREGTIRTLERLCEEYGESPHVSYAYYRLGELYSSVSLRPEAMTEAMTEAQAVAATTVFDSKKAIEYFEKSVASGAPTAQWVLSSKCHLVGLYGEAWREADRQKVLDELVNLDVSGPIEPAYLGPYEMQGNQEATLSVRIDWARVHAARVKERAAQMLVHYAMRGRDATTAQANIEALVAKYPGGDIEKAAQEATERRRNRPAPRTADK